jgi:15-cis-phytoene synthase
VSPPIGHSVGMSAAWDIMRWSHLEAEAREKMLGANQDEAMHIAYCSARKILQAFSSSFFLVTRFLPQSKRTRVAAVYAAVRYPDEIVDTFAVTESQKRSLLNEWREHYATALACRTVRASLVEGVPTILAAFAQIVRESGIPPEHYQAFLDAMGRDIAPRPFVSFEDLVSNYVYGSAIVVGYFLAHVYGVSSAATLTDAYAAAADLGTALQLTNFARDFREDEARGRTYIPQDIARNRDTLESIWFLAEQAETHYSKVASALEVFAPHTRSAIGACIDVYRLLNQRILQSKQSLEVRLSVPVIEKLRALPASKYWRLPLAYVGGL